MLQPGRKVRTKNERRINAPPAKLAFSVRHHCSTHSINSCKFVQSRITHGGIIGISRDIMPKKGRNSSIMPCVMPVRSRNILNLTAKLDISDTSLCSVTVL